MKLEKRENSIDIIKGIGIILVVIAHINLGKNLFLNTLNKVIYSFHMPLFFLYRVCYLNIEKILKSF